MSQISPQNRILAVCCIAICSSCYPITYLFSFLPEMTLWMGYRDQDKGYVAAFVASSYYIGRSISSNIWGWLFNRVNPKYTILTSLVLNAVLCSAFGFCVHLPEVIVVRFLIGITNGVMTTVRALVFTWFDKPRQAFVSCVIWVSWGVGMSVSPLIAGRLATPSFQYPMVFGNVQFLSTYPYVLPAIAGCVFNCIAVVAVWAVYPNDVHTNYERLVNNDEDTPETGIFVNDGNGQNLTDTLRISLDNKEERTDVPLKNLQLKPHKTLPLSTSDPSTEMTELCDNIKPNHGTIREPSTDSEKTLCPSNSTNTTRESSRTKAVQETSENNEKPKSNYYNLLRNRNVMKSLLVYAAVAIIDFSTIDIVPVWSSSNPSLGGINYTTNQIGIIIAIVSLPMLITVMILLPRLEAKFGSIPSLQVFIVTTTISCSLIPTTRYISNEWVQWLTIIALLFLFQLSVTAWAILITIITNAMVDTDEIGHVNGLVCGVGAASMALGPLIFGNIYSATVSADLGPPIDASSTFVLSGLITFSSFFVTLSLPKL